MDRVYKGAKREDREKEREALVHSSRTTRRNRQQGSQTATTPVAASVRQNTPPPFPRGLLCPREKK